jgi:hypothetical protein
MPKLGKRILTLYQLGYRYIVTLGEKELIVRVCHEELIECIAEALKDYALELELESGD